MLINHCFAHTKYSLRVFVEDIDRSLSFSCSPLSKTNSIIDIRARAREASHRITTMHTPDQHYLLDVPLEPVPFVASIFDRQSIYSIRRRLCMRGKLGAESIPTCTKAWNFMPVIALAAPPEMPMQNTAAFRTAWLNVHAQMHNPSIL